MPAQASVVIDVDLKNAIKNIEKMATGFKRSFTEINSAISIGSKAFDVLTGAVSRTVGIVSDLIRASNEQVLADKRLIASLKLHGITSDETFKSLQRFNGALQQQLGFGDEQLQQLETVLLSMGVHISQLEGATKATLGLTEVMGGDFKDKAKVVAKALNGDTGALKEYGIVVSSVSEAQQKLNDMFSVAAARGGTVAGQLDTLEKNVGDLQQALGEAFTGAEGFKRLIELTNRATLNLIKLFDSGVFISGIDKLAAAAEMLARSVPLVLKALGSLPVVGGAFSAAGIGAEALGSALFAPGGPEAIQRGGAGAGRFKMTRFSGTTATGGASEGSQAGAKGGGRALDPVIRRTISLGKEVHSVTASVKILEETVGGAAEKFGEGLDKMAGSIMTSGIADAFLAIGEVIAGGFEDADKALRAAVGGMIKNLGVMLIQAGTAGVLAGTLGLIPFFAPLFGGAPAVGAGIAAIAGGTAMVALGSALGGTDGAAPAVSRGRSAGGAIRSTPTDRTGLPVGSGGFGREGEQGPTVINVNFSRGMVVGGKREVAHFIQDSLASVNLKPVRRNG